MQWDDVTSYSYTDTHTVKDWGWEFIRRDERYKKEWQVELSNFNKRAVLKGLLDAADPSQFTNLTHNHHTLIEPTDVERFAILSVNAWKWQLRYYQHPDAKKLIQDNHFKVRNLYRGDTRDADEVEDAISVDFEDHSLLAVIDMLKPIKPQMVELSKIANKRQAEQDKLQKKLPNPQFAQTKATKISQVARKRWIVYLRCLDAHAAKIENQNAANMIFPNASPSPIRKWYDTMAQIKEHTENRYRSLMY